LDAQEKSRNAKENKTVEYGYDFSKQNSDKVEILLSGLYSFHFVCVSGLLLRIERALVFAYYRVLAIRVAALLHQLQVTHKI